MNYFRLIHFTSFLSFLSILGHTSAQTPTSLHGVVVDAETGEALSFVTVMLSSRSAGASTDTLGQFSFQAAPIAGDSLQVNYVGYLSQSLALNGKSEQFFSVKLIPVSRILEEVVITSDPSPGKTLMKKVLAHSHQNDPSQLDRLDARRWTRSEVSALDPQVASDPSSKTAVRGGMLFGSRVRAFEKVRPADDTLRGQTPLFFAEKLGTYILINHPFTENERVIAIKTTGLESDKMLEPLARWDAGSVNLYDARVMLFSKAFVSPIGPEAMYFYDFYIVDSTDLPNGFHTIILQPIPKVWHGNVFTGRITVEDSAYALIAADLRLSKDANLNYIESLALHQTFQPAVDHTNGRTVLVPYESALTLRYEAGLDLLGIPLPANADGRRLISRMSAIFDSVRVNDPNGTAVAAGGMVSSVRSQDSGASDDFWKQSRPDSLSNHEVAIYRMADALRNDPKQQFKDKLFSTLGTGAYYIHDKVYLGPIGTLVSLNHIEGARFRVGFRTQEGFSKNVGLYGHVAYGTRDKQFKGGFGLKYLWNTRPYAKTEVHTESDYNAIAQWYDEIDADGFINSLLRKNVPYNQTYQTQLTLSHDQQMGANCFVKGGLAYRTISPSFDFNYPNPDFIGYDITPQEPRAAHRIFVSQASVALRFAWHERSRLFDYERLPTGSKFPTMSLIYTQGFRFAGADFVFQKLNIEIFHTTLLTPKAALIWNLDAGKIYGTLPSLLLQVPRGNNTYVMSRYVFNTMQPYEFAADHYVSLQSRLAMGGMLLDRVPLMQKLGWRERLTFNAFWGDLSLKNRDFNKAQMLIAPNNSPFMEAGIGVENIFHLFSIDYIKRLNYLTSPGAAGNRSGVFLGMKVVF